MKSNRRKPGVMKLVVGIMLIISGFYGVGCDLEQYVFLNIIFYLTIIAGGAFSFMYVDEYVNYRKKLSRKNKKLEVI